MNGHCHTTDDVARMTQDSVRARAADASPGCEPTASTACGVLAEQHPIARNDSDYWDDDDTGCANCGGEGFTYGCSWDWQCDTYDEGEGTCLCTRRCDWCNPLTPSEIAERDKLRAVLATALAKDKVAGMRSDGGER